LPIGETITIALPYMNGTQTKVKGQIVRCNQEGFGIELFRKRKDTYLKLIK
jgi:ribosome maturation factor RimP